nr:Chain X, Zinc-transporting ATPase [Synechocystis sp. PCC 6803]2OFH_X Chain X, Zinc-transporting ATPase [Synechocystis sp. PCC 6803]
MTQSSPLKTQQMQVGGMDCTSCKLKIEGSLERLKGVAEASVTVATGRLTVTYDPKQVSEITIQERIAALGYTLAEPKSSVTLNGHKHPHSHREEGHSHSHGAGEFNLKQEL